MLMFLRFCMWWWWSMPFIQQWGSRGRWIALEFEASWEYVVTTCLKNDRNLHGKKAQFLMTLTDYSKVSLYLYS